MNCNYIKLIKNVNPKSDFITRKFTKMTSYNKIKDLNYDVKDIFKKIDEPLRLAIVNYGLDDGFGDYMFCIKFCDYLHKWYGDNIEIAVYTNNMDRYTLLLKNSNKFKDYDLISLERNIMDYYDGIIMAPFVSNKLTQSVVMRFFRGDEKQFLNKAFAFSEYNVNNMITKKQIDFITGVGPGYLGLMFENFKSIINVPKNLLLKNNNFILIYLNKNDDKTNIQNCLNSFILMVCEKYKYKNQLQIVLNKPLYNIIQNSKNLLSKITSIFKQIHFIHNTPDRIPDIGFIFRFDILPVTNETFLSLLKHSMIDVLLTGDQSITDCLSCCIKKNIFYQTLKHKTDFALALSKYLPNKYLSSTETSCGSLQAINYKSNNFQFRKTWDFGVLAKPYFDQILIYLYLYNYCKFTNK